MYKLNSGFALKQIIDEYIVVATGEKTLKFSSVLVLNEVGAKVFKLLQAGKQPDDMAQAIAQEYDIPFETAAADVNRFLQKLEKDGVCSRDE